MLGDVASNGRPRELFAEALVSAPAPLAARGSRCY
jgi:hypothetical protein